MIVVNMTGVQGAGKDTVIAGLVSELPKHGISIHVAEVEGGFQSIQRWAKSLGFPINENTTAKTQYFLALANMENDIKNRMIAEKNDVDVFINARSVCDVIPYTLWQTNIAKEEANHIIDILVNHIARYPVDLLFAPEPLSGIVGDGERSTSKQYQDEIYRLFKSMWHVYRLNCIEVPVFSNVASESISERIKFCTKIIMVKLRGVAT